MPDETPRPTLDDLRELMDRLRSPEGCAWDRALELDTLLPYLREELEEVLEAARSVEAGELPPSELCEELGDLLFNVVFTARLCQERGWFDLDDVVAGAHAKIQRRHPHVFGDERSDDPAEIERIWERVKARERQEKQRKLAAWRARTDVNAAE